MYIISHFLTPQGVVQYRCSSCVELSVVVVVVVVVIVFLLSESVVIRHISGP